MAKRFAKVSGCFLALLGFATAIFGLSANAAQYDGERIQRELLVSMLLGDEPAETRLAARAIAQMYKVDTELLDCVAERLYHDATPELNTKKVNAQIWYADTLKRSTNNRYVDVLVKSRDRYTHPKILQVIDEAVASQGAAVVPQYVPGSLNLAAKRAAIDKDLAAMRESTHPAFGSIKPESSLQDVFAALGVPDAMTGVSMRTKAWARMNVLMVSYLGAGIVVVRMDTSGSPHWVVTETFDELVPLRENYSGPNVGLAQISVALRGIAFRDFVKTGSARIKNDKQATHLMAKRFMAYPTPADKFEDYGMAIMMKRIANTKEPEMIDVLRKLANTPGKSKAKSTAKTLVLKYERNLAAGKSMGDEPEEADEDRDPDDKDMGDKDHGASDGQDSDEDPL